MKQSDLNSLYNLLMPLYQGVAARYDKDVSVEFQRLLREVAEGKNDIILPLNAAKYKHAPTLMKILEHGNTMCTCMDVYEPKKPVELKHLFHSLRIVGQISLH